MHRKDGLIFREQCTAERRRHCRMRWVHKMAVRIAHTGISADLMSRSKDIEYRKLEKLPKEIVMEKIMAKLEEEKQTWE